MGVWRFPKACMKKLLMYVYVFVRGHYRATTCQASGAICAGVGEAQACVAPNGYSSPATSLVFGTQARCSAARVKAARSSQVESCVPLAQWTAPRGETKSPTLVRSAMSRWTSARCHRLTAVERRVWAS
jgi:hypothetical protein